MPSSDMIMYEEEFQQIRVILQKLNFTPWTGEVL